jgi:hypothetical protein
MDITPWDTIPNPATTFIDSEDTTPWSRKETSILLDLISKEEDWLTIAKTINKTPQQCCEWFDYLEYISKHIPKRQKSKSAGQQRKRRKAAQIERLYKCQEKYCHRSYGTEGALKMHIKLKHPAVTYNETYQQQARRAAAIIGSQKMEDDEESYEEIPSGSVPVVAPVVPQGNMSGPGVIVQQQPQQHQQQHQSISTNRPFVVERPFYNMPMNAPTHNRFIVPPRSSGVGPNSSSAGFLQPQGLPPQHNGMQGCYNVPGTSMEHLPIMKRNLDMNSVPLPSEKRMKGNGYEQVAEEILNSQITDLPICQPIIVSPQQQLQSRHPMQINFIV